MYDITKQITHVIAQIISTYVYVINTNIILPLNELESLFTKSSSNTFIIDNSVAINFARAINT
jgi:hypothetical protein